MISIVTGTLNRFQYLDELLKNTIYANDKLELVLVDGGSTDGTLEYLRNIKHDNFKLVEVGGRSSYPHYMNLGIQNAKYEYICQWNDDVLMINDWNDVINEIDSDHDFYLFNWKYGKAEYIKYEQFVKGNDHSNNWFLLNTKDDIGNGEIVMNYGIYNKKIFREIGLYNNDYQYYFCDGDMCERAYQFDYKVKTLRDIKVLSIQTVKMAIHYDEDKNIYDRNLINYKKKILPKNLEYLQ